MYVAIGRRKVFYQAIVSIQAMDDTEPLNPGEPEDPEYVAIVATNGDRFYLIPTKGLTARDCVAGILTSMKNGTPYLLP